jgi:membrane protein involved in colicin uptake
MQLIDMQYAKIVGTEVMVEVSSAAEAKAAIKELKHKKKELAILKKRLLKEQKSARAAHAKAERERQREAKAKGMVASLKRVGRMLSGPDTVDARDPAEIGADLKQLDDIAHNIDSCIVQLEGKLLRLT